MTKGVELPKLNYELLRITELDESVVERLFFLMSENYNCVNSHAFRSDLFNKQFIGILKDKDNQIQGFTTFAINPAGTGTADYNILFSGDTIISPDYWGTQELAKGWCKTVGGFIAGSPQKKLLWFLLSKGHRTYMYMPLFFEKYYPALDKNNETDFFSIINKCSIALYNSSWKPEMGVVSFEESHGELKKIHADATFKKLKNNLHVQFFLEKNPNFYKGDELVCMAELSLDNFKRFTKNAVLEGAATPLFIEHD